VTEGGSPRKAAEFLIAVVLIPSLCGVVPDRVLPDESRLSFERLGLTVSRLLVFAGQGYVGSGE
jgi:hypothetical protein